MTVDPVGRWSGDLLAHDRQLEVAGRGVMGADLSPVAVLQRRDDSTPGGVVLRVRAGHDEHVDGKPDAVALHLDVALLHHIEEPDLDLFREFRKLVDAEDSAVGPRHETKMDGQLVAEGSTLGDLDRVHVADQVCDRNVGRGQLLYVAVFAMNPDDFAGIAVFGDQRPGIGGDRGEGVVMDLASHHAGEPLVQKTRQGTDHPGLGLSSLAQKDQVVAAEKRVLDRRDHGVLVTDDVFEHRLPGANPGQQILAELVADAAGSIADRSKLTEAARRRGPGVHGRASRTPGALTAGRPSSHRRASEASPSRGG